MTTERCPAEPELLEWADEPEVSESIGAHVETCLACQQQLADLHRSIFRLQDPVVLPETVPGTAPASQPPGTIGKYLIVGKLPGGFAFESFRGVHPVLHIDVRIDVGRDAVPNTAEFREPLAAEARRLIAIEQPHLSRVRESGYFGDRLFLVADYGQHERLDQQLLRGAFATDDAAATVGPLAAAALALAQSGISPGEINVAGMLMPAPAGPMWTDWGAATLFRSPGAAAPLAVHQRLASLFVDVVEPSPSTTRHDRRTAVEALARLRQAGQLSATREAALRTALVDHTNSQQQLVQLVRQLTRRPGLWSRLFG